MSSKRPQLGIIFLTVFIDLIGFGIVLPMLPLYSKNFGASGLVIGLIMGIYSFMQFIFSPMWGRWSDRIGRRPLLLFSTIGAAISYLIFGFGAGTTGNTAILIFLLSRMMAGFCGANITVAQAYIADITPPEKRSKSMALIGVAFGLGFVFGPAIGGISMQYLGMSGPGWVAAAFCAANFIGAYFLLPESLKPNSEHVKPRPRFTQWMHTLGHPRIGLLIGVFFLSTFCFTCFEVTLGLLVSKNFGLNFKDGHDVKTITWLFAYCGIVGVFVQGGMVGRLVKVMGEARLIALSLALVAVSLSPLAFIHHWTPLLIVLAVLSIGTGLTRAPVFGLISILAPVNEQGATLGVAQSAGSLARITGPVFAATLFDFHPAWPYVASGALSFVTAILVWQWIVPADARSRAVAPA
jgi:MFS family permease